MNIHKVLSQHYAELTEEYSEEIQTHNMRPEFQKPSEIAPKSLRLCNNECELQNAPFIIRVYEDDMLLCSWEPINTIKDLESFFLRYLDI